MNVGYHQRIGGSGNIVGWKTRAAASVLGAMAACVAHAASPVPQTQPAPPASSIRDASIDDYRQHLTALMPVVESCAKARDTKTCDPILVGPDDRIPLGAGRRTVRYGWLRVLLLQAQLTDKAATSTGREKDAEPAGTRAPEPTTSQLLEAAEKRLTADLAQASDPVTTAPSHAQERATMQQILAGKDFRGLKQATPKDSLLEKLGNWLNRLFASMGGLQAHAAWVGRALVWGFVLAVCIALVWALLQLERRWRVRLVPEERGLASGAASARNWQLWLEDARRAAARGQWREAVHFVYWAAISRLESRRLWPADRARTPREYLALVAAEDPRKANLAALTGGFERIWYGGRDAAESDYRRAEAQATELIEGNAEGGAR
jgi:hypothetical protein